ncbi:MAG: DUF3352 domain-containing protein [Chloroflexota bacterium]
MRSRRRDVLIVLIVLGLIIGGLAPIFLVVDPFDLHIVDRLSGDFDAAALAAPPDAIAYVGVNLLGAEQEELAGLAAKFAGDGGGLLEELGLSLETDVIPWIGQYAGWVLVGMEVDSFNQTAVSDWVLLVEARRTGGADDFLLLLAERWAAQNGVSIANQEYAGVGLTVLPGLVLAREGRLVMIGSSITAVQQTIDAKNGDDLTDTDIYSDAVVALPTERLVTAYVNGSYLPMLRDAATVWTETNLVFVPVSDVESISMAGFLVDEGVRLDMATIYDVEALSAARREAVLTVQDSPQTAVHFPNNTFLYVSGQPLNVTWPSFIESEGADFAESMLLLGENFGFDPSVSIFPLLDGEAAIGFVSGTEGMLAAQTGIGVETAVLLGSSQVAQARAPLDGLTQAIQAIPLPIATIENYPLGDGDVYELQAILGGLQLAYGSANGQIVVATTGEMAQSLHFTEAESLATTPRYQQAVRAFRGENGLTFYSDVAALRGVLGVVEPSASDATAVLQPIHTIAANNNVVDDILLNRIYLFMD